MFVVAVVCFPHVRVAMTDCPDAHASIAIQTPVQATCLTLHVEGLMALGDGLLTVADASILLLFVLGSLGLWRIDIQLHCQQFVLRVARQYDRIRHIFLKKIMKWFTKQYSLYESNNWCMAH